MSCSSDEVLDAAMDGFMQNHDVNATAPEARSRRRCSAIHAENLAMVTAIEEFYAQYLDG
jgi:hypothetical protein